MVRMLQDQIGGFMPTSLCPRICDCSGPSTWKPGSQLTQLPPPSSWWTL